MSDRDILLNLGYDDVIIFDNPSYEGALVGISWDNQAIYDYDLMVESLIKEGMTAEEAADFISYNSSYRQGSEYPIIINNLKRWEEI